MSVDIQLPRNRDAASLFTWASNLVTALRRREVSTAGRIAAVESTTGTAAADIAALETGLSATNANLDVATGNITSLQGAVTTINGDIIAINGDVVTINGQVVTLDAALDSLQGDVGDLQGELTGVSSSLATLAVDFATTDAVVGGITSDRAAALAALALYADDVQDAITAAGGHAQSVYDAYETAAAAQQEGLASHYLTEASNRVEQFVRIEEDEVLSSSIATVSASLGTTQASLTSEITARANGDSANATAIATVQTQANGNSSSITTLASAVDGIEARWGVAVNLNGHVVGLVQLDGAASGSTFTVVADKVVIAHPSSSGVVIVPFVVGLVAGVSTVGINGNLVVDGSIIARHIAAGQIDASKINVSALSSIVANIGTITAGRMQRADGKMVIDLDNKSIVIET